MNLVISHRKREMLNAACNAADARGRTGVVEFKIADYFSEEELKNLSHSDNQPQDALFWPGMVVVAKSTGRQLKNALPYEILGFTEKTVVVAPSAGEGKEALELKRAHFFKSMRLQYALTFASIQGTTVKCLVALHDTTHPHFGRRNLFVGSSRAVANDKLVVY